MEQITPRIVIETHTPVEDQPVPGSTDPLPPTTPGPGQEEEGEGGRGGGGGGRGGEDGAFAKIARTVQFIKVWAKRAEKPSEARDEFLGKFKMTGPNIDDALSHGVDSGVEKAGGEVSVRSKRRRVFFNPSGIWLYRWLGVITVAVLYNAFLIIVRETFDQLNSNFLPLWLVLDVAADVIYLLDMLVRFLTSESAPIIIIVHCIIIIRKGCGFRDDQYPAETSLY